MNWAAVQHAEAWPLWLSAAVAALIVGATFIALLAQVAPAFTVVAPHFPFAGAWSALALRALRPERAWVDACDVSCVVLCLIALAMATFV